MLIDINIENLELESNVSMVKRAIVEVDSL